VVSVRAFSRDDLATVQKLRPEGQEEACETGPRRAGADRPRAVARAGGGRRRPGGSGSARVRDGRALRQSVRRRGQRPTGERREQRPAEERRAGRGRAPRVVAVSVHVAPVARGPVEETPRRRPRPRQIRRAQHHDPHRFGAVLVRKARTWFFV